MTMNELRLKMHVFSEPVIKRHGAHYQRQRCRRM